MLTSFLLAATVAAAPVPGDYGLEQNWLCRPGRRDACTVNLDWSTVAADGQVTQHRHVAASAPKADCFYVYPTVSFDASPNSDMVANDEERRVIEAQFARFGEQCRLFAPLYRQVTLTALRAAMAGKPMAADRSLAYADVLAAWRHYLAHDNQGRPFALIGHSQGSGMLKRLIQQEVDGKPLQQQMLSAMLAGTNVAVPVGKDIGGDFKATPLCRQVTQTGCVIAWVSFGDRSPRPSSSRFGRVEDSGQQAACTNPAALSGGKALLASIFPTVSAWGMMRKPAPWTSNGAAIATPFVEVPGLFVGECVSAGDATYLLAHINAEPKDARTDDIGGEVMIGTEVSPDWGFHLIDVNLVQGDMIRLIGTRATAWEAKAR